MQNSDMENRQKKPADDSRVRILVVDDHPNTANMLARAISRLGSHLDVTSATSGSEALEYVGKGAADILITDMMMPEMNGLELIERSKNNPTGRPPISFIVTAYNTTELQERASAFAVKEILIKPVHPQLIWRHIINAVNELQGTNLPYADNSDEDTENSLENANLDLIAETQKEKLEIEHLLWEIASEFQPHAHVKNLLLVVGETGTTATVWGDVLQLNQVFRILIENGIKHTPEGGTITITVEQQSNKVLIKIRDTGRGIPSSMRSEIFNHKDKISRNNHNDTETYGTDLPFVKTIVDVHGGNINVESEPGLGSQFIVILPIITETNLFDKKEINQGEKEINNNN